MNGNAEVLGVLGAVLDWNMLLQTHAHMYEQRERERKRKKRSDIPVQVASSWVINKSLSADTHEALYHLRKLCKINHGGWDFREKAHVCIGDFLKCV